MPSSVDRSAHTAAATINAITTSQNRLRGEPVFRALRSGDAIACSTTDGRAGRYSRRGESGTVVVRAEVGPDGVPTSVSVARSSGSRTLDRAAVSAVNRWQFRPAQLEGRPTVGSVLVPIEFKPQR